MTTATTTTTGIVIYRGEEFWVVNSLQNRGRQELYIVKKDNTPLIPTEERQERLAAITARGWQIWWESRCVVSTPTMRIAWDKRGPNNPVPTIAEIEARLADAPDTDEPFGSRVKPELCVGGEWVPATECKWIDRRGGGTVVVS